VAASQLQHSSQIGSTKRRKPFTVQPQSDTRMNQSIPSARERLLAKLFKGRIPSLWCPPLTHYDRDGRIDARRIAAHLRHLSPFVGGFLIPGSTGDGWELTPSERREVLAIGLDLARQVGFYVLIGALNPDATKAGAIIREDVEWLKSRLDQSDSASAMQSAHVCGFTICPPRGKGLGQEEIRHALSLILGLDLPIAIYQLPQVTLNELSPETAANLASRYPNFVFFKDTSGTDAVVLSDKTLAGVFTARGAEGEYARWLKAAGGKYDGFLLASANCFAREMHQVITEVEAGRLETAKRLSARVSAAVNDVMRLASNLPHGNAFANANKAIDHFFAHGPKASTLPAPRLHAGSSLPPGLIHSTAEILLRQELMPAQGYLE
jgi:dihydrodipicolinate synthase/N-acetylneuraminate lyase